MILSMVRSRSTAVVAATPAVKNSSSGSIPLRTAAFPTPTTTTRRDIHVLQLQRGGRYWTTTTRRLPHHQQQRSLRSQTPQQPQQPPSSSSSNLAAATAGGGAGDFTSDIISLYSILLQRAALAAGIIYCISEYVADITLCEGMYACIYVCACWVADLWLFLVGWLVVFPRITLFCRKQQPLTHICSFIPLSHNNACQV
jgi:hypothetical protein